jgi:putative DNA primase/helicase
MAARFAADCLHQFRGATAKMPNALGNREADNWAPLVAIADAAGGRWPDLGRQVAANLTLANRATEECAAVMLLEDLHAVLMARTGDRIQSADLVKALLELEHRPWAEWRNGKPITPNAIARLLAPFNIRPFEMRMGARVVRGYEASQFADTFARYVETASVQSATPLQPADQHRLEDN